MTLNAPLVFKGIAPEQFVQLTAKAAASGTPISGNSGTTSKLGVEVTWNYNPAAQQLTLQSLKTPFFVTLDDIEARFKLLVEQSIAGL
ncbi:MAG TPA: hypothetical protein VK716_05540 [Terracidiphilus sp.]|jgi:hypothetical protein|nr:hypothetical protein [Terracidiphilus sp.]